MEYPNKDKYVGEFRNGQKHGHGKYFFAEGTIFEGEWAHNMQVKGRLVLFNGDEFEGTFSNNLRK